jgi:hypothetical protein
MPYLTSSAPTEQDSIYLVVCSNGLYYPPHGFIIQAASIEEADRIARYQYGKLTGLDSAVITSRLTAYDDLPEIMFGESCDI